MGIFDFTKKKKQEVKKKESVVFVPLNKRREDRYFTKELSSSLGEVVDVAKHSLSIGIKEKSVLKSGDYLDISVLGTILEAEVVRITPVKVAFSIKQSLEQDMIQDHLKTLETFSIDLPPCQSFEAIQDEKELRVNRAIIHLMLELDDPNTNIDKFAPHIQELPSLQERLMKKANSIEQAKAGEVEDVSGAVARLGFTEVKKIVYDFINNEVALSNEALPHFENFEAYHLFLTAFFKKVAPLFNFNDIKNEGQSLLNMLLLPASMIYEEFPEVGKWYKGPKKLFSLELRFLERKDLGCDYIKISRTYFVEQLKVFRYLFDGFVLGYQMLYPHYLLDMSIEISERKLRFGYICYLTILALQYYFDNDNYSGAQLFSKLQRFGMEPLEAKEFMDKIVESVNSQLEKISKRGILKYKDIPTSTLSFSSLLGTGPYVEYLKKSFTILDERGQRLALRYEDEMFSHDILEKLLAFDEFEFRKKPFCVLPCERLADENLYLDQFKGFDLLVFKNIDKLSPKLFEDFAKIWRDFEGQCIVTYSTYSMLDYNNSALYKLLQPFVVDFPSYFQSPTLYVKMLTYSLQKIEKFFGKTVCDLGDFKGKNMTQESVYWFCIEKV